MTIKRVFSILTIIGAGFCVINKSFADEAVIYSENAPFSNKNIVQQRVKQEDPQEDTYFLISTYKPNYLLPFYYNSDPYDPTANDHQDNQKNLKHEEIKFQLSFKFPLWSEIFNHHSTLYLAYTQQSFWQAYSSSPYFRETNYEPELFLANNINLPVLGDWRFNFINVGAMHQSNGRGGDLERSWDRVYLETIFANHNWMVSIKPWVVINDSSMKSHNPNIAYYLGYDRIVIAYKYHRQTFALEKSNIESGFQRGAVQLTWSFPLVAKVKGYVQYFNGYGQSLLEYNHRTNSAGIGIALNDWI